MTQPAITLLVSDEKGRRETVSVRSKMFAIGRSAGNDLAIDDPRLSRRHALIEVLNDRVQLSDCGSQSGLFVNGMRVAGAMSLTDGDTVSLGGVRDVVVRINGTVSNPIRSVSRDVTVGRSATGNVQPAYSESSPARFGLPLVIGTTVVLFLIGAGFLIAIISNRNSRPVVSDVTTVRSNTSDDSTDKSSASESGGSSGAGGSDSSSAVVASEQIEKGAMQVIRGISSDETPYVFPPYALNEIQQRVEQYRTSSGLPVALRALQQHNNEIVTAAGHEGIEPGLVNYIALTETDGGRSGADSIVAARRVLPALQALRPLFQSADADGSLIIVAAYRMGPGTNKSHPLLAAIRRLVKRPQTERNVWFLHEHDGIDARTYDFVLNFLALGIIAQSPHQYGIKV